MIHDVDQPRIVAFIASHHGEGTSTVALDFARTAAALAKADVLLVDAAPAGRWDGMPGLVESVAAGAFEHAVRPLEPGVDTALLVGSGGLQPDLLRRSGLAPVWDAVRGHYRLAVIDAPALESGIEGVALGAQVDAVVVVVEAERTRAPVALRLVDLLRRAEAPVTGAVLNKRRFYVPAWIYDRF